MRFQTQQGISCRTFNPPPLEGFPTVPEIFDAHAINSPNHPLFVFEDSDVPAHHDVRTICYPEGVQAIHRAAHVTSNHYLQCKEKYLVQKKEQGFHPTFGILANTDSISYFCLIVGIMRLGCTAFPISTRNSPKAIAHLIAKTGVLQLFVGPDLAMQRLAADSFEILSQEGHKVEALPIPQFTDLFLEDKEEYCESGSIEKLEPDKPAVIIHSSGSTAFPKPIPISHRDLVRWGQHPYHGKVDMCSKILAAHSVPMFHAMGVISTVWTICNGVVMSYFKPTSPPVIPTPDSVLEGIVETKSDFVFCVPSFVEHWGQSLHNTAILKSLSAVVFGGAPISKSIGDQLVQQGVRLVPFYGATEIGPASVFLPDNRPRVDDWEYFKFSPQLGLVMVPQDGLEDVFEAIIVETEVRAPVVKNTVIDGRDAYATNDLFIRQPTDPQRWKVYGRADDQLMLSTGEKTNPGPLEPILMSDSHVSAAVMFGRGRLQNGVLVEPRKEYSFDPSNESKLAEFRNAIWPSVEKVNQFAPSHSRIFKEMIVVTNPMKPLESTAKGTPRRQVALRMYADEIEAAYTAVKDSAQTDITFPTKWTPETVVDFVRAAINKAFVNPGGDTNDIFQGGCDSLQATRIRNTILYALRETSRVSIHDIPYNFVYAHPSVQSLAEFVTDLLLGVKDTAGSTEQTKIQEMEALVTKYSTNFHTHRPSADFRPSADVGEVILLTGSTGRLGSYLLAKLIADPNINRIFACNRATAGSSLKDRQHAAFLEWGLGLELLASPKVQLLEMDVTQPSLGMERSVLDQIRDSITSIIHNAWRVDFNLALSSFEPFIKGVRNLVDLSLSSPRTRPPRILFTSSISVLRNHMSAAPETSIPDARTAVGGGYSEGKWVAERILELASQATGVQVTIVRVGQLSGGTGDGAWNKKEWVPAMARGGQLIGCLPRRNEEIAWVPADVAASALLEMRHTDDQFLHLVHPKPVAWSLIFEAIGNTLSLPLVPYSEWLVRLEAYQLSVKGDGQAESALSLIDFYRTGSDIITPDASQETRRMTPSPRTDLACKASPALAQAGALSTESAEEWVKYWRRVGLLDV